jgi:hypothetical protein
MEDDCGGTPTNQNGEDILKASGLQEKLAR